MENINTNKMLDSALDEFNKNISNMNNNFTIFPDGNIFNIKTGDIISIDSLKKSINSDIINFLKNKLNIEDIIENVDISEFQSGADKILEDEKESYGIKLQILINNKIFYESIYCTDDYKYEIDPKIAKINILKNIEIIKDSYYLIIMNIFLKIFESKYSKVVEKSQYSDNYLNLNLVSPSQLVSVLAGGRKKNK